MFNMIYVDPIAVSFFTTVGIALAYYYGRHTVIKIIEETIAEKQGSALEKAIDHCVDRLIDDGYLLSTLSEDGEVELIKLDDVIEDIDGLKDLLKNNA